MNKIILPLFNPVDNEDEKDSDILDAEMGDRVLKKRHISKDQQLPVIGEEKLFPTIMTYGEEYFHKEINSKTEDFKESGVIKRRSQLRKLRRIKPIFWIFSLKNED